MVNIEEDNAEIKLTFFTVDVMTDVKLFTCSVLGVSGQKTDHQLLLIVLLM